MEPFGREQSTIPDFTLQENNSVRNTSVPRLDSDIFSRQGTENARLGPSTSGLDIHVPVTPSLYNGVPLGLQFGDQRHTWMAGRHCEDDFSDLDGLSAPHRPVFASYSNQPDPFQQQGVSAVNMDAKNRHSLDSYPSGNYSQNNMANPNQRTRGLYRNDVRPTQSTTNRNMTITNMASSPNGQSYVGANDSMKNNFQNGSHGVEQGKTNHELDDDIDQQWRELQLPGSSDDDESSSSDSESELEMPCVSSRSNRPQSAKNSLYGRSRLQIAPNDPELDEQGLDIIDLDDDEEVKKVEKEELRLNLPSDIGDSSPKLRRSMERADAHAMGVSRYQPLTVKEELILLSPPRVADPPKEAKPSPSSENSLANDVMKLNDLAKGGNSEGVALEVLNMNIQKRKLALRRRILSESDVSDELTFNEDDCAFSPTPSCSSGSHDGYSRRSSLSEGGSGRNTPDLYNTTIAERALARYKMRPRASSDTSEMGDIKLNKMKMKERREKAQKKGGPLVPRKLKPLFPRPPNKDDHDTDKMPGLNFSPRRDTDGINLNHSLPASSKLSKPLLPKNRKPDTKESSFEASSSPRLSKSLNIKQGSLHAKEVTTEEMVKAKNHLDNISNKLQALQEHLTSAKKAKEQNSPETSSFPFPENLSKVRAKRLDPVAKSDDGVMKREERGKAHGRSKSDVTQMFLQKDALNESIEDKNRTPTKPSRHSSLKLAKKHTEEGTDDVFKTSPKQGSLKSIKMPRSPKSQSLDFGADSKTPSRQGSLKKISRNMSTEQQSDEFGMHSVSEHARSPTRHGSLKKIKTRKLSSERKSDDFSSNDTTEHAHSPSRQGSLKKINRKVSPDESERIPERHGSLKEINKNRHKESPKELTNSRESRKQKVKNVPKDSSQSRGVDGNNVDILHINAELEKLNSSYRSGQSALQTKGLSSDVANESYLLGIDKPLSHLMNNSHSICRNPNYGGIGDTFDDL